SQFDHFPRYYCSHLQGIFLPCGKSFHAIATGFWWNLKSVRNHGTANNGKEMHPGQFPYRNACDIWRGLSPRIQQWNQAHRPPSTKPQSRLLVNSNTIREKPWSWEATQSQQKEQPAIFPAPED